MARYTYDCQDDAANTTVVGSNGATGSNASLTGGAATTTAAISQPGPGEVGSSLTKAFALDGGNEIYFVLPQASPNQGVPQSIGFAFKLVDNEAFAYPLTDIASVGTGLALLQFSDSGVEGSLTLVDDGGEETLWEALPSLTSWHWFLLVLNQPAADWVAELFVDGVSQGSQTVGSGSNTVTLSSAGEPGFSGTSFYLAAVNLYNSVENSTTAAALYDERLAPPAPPAESGCNKSGPNLGLGVHL